MSDTAKFVPNVGGKLAIHTTPREALTLALSHVDDYSSVVISLGKVDDEGGTDCRVVVSSPSVFHSVGLIEDAKRSILNDD